VADLVVELYGYPIGHLTGDSRTFDFIVDEAAFDQFELDSPILSISVPLNPVPTRARKDRRQNYFAELLPEGEMLASLAQEARLDPFDVIGLLRRYGRDVSGALQIWDPSVPGEPKRPALVPVDEGEVARLLRNVRRNPIGNERTTGKSSLAGVQDKIVLARTVDSWNRVIDGYPSTHIVKPAPSGAAETIFDEEYGSRFVRAAGLATFPTTIEYFDGDPALVVQRYDRDPAAPEGRVHQEDFNQALGTRGIQKYQRYGGGATLTRVAAVFTRVGDLESARRLLALTTLSVAVGNLDMHAKNISVLHPADRSMTLAPAYDVVPQLHQSNLDGEMAMSIGGEFRHAALTKEHLLSESISWGLHDGVRIIDETLEVVQETVRREEPLDGSSAPMRDGIARTTANLLDGLAAGSRP
jgi:serine/threonine-protein kinase HipA